MGGVKESRAGALAPCRLVNYHALHFDGCVITLKHDAQAHRAFVLAGNEDMRAGPCQIFGRDRAAVFAWVESRGNQIGLDQERRHLVLLREFRLHEERHWLDPVWPEGFSRLWRGCVGQDNRMWVASGKSERDTAGRWRKGEEMGKSPGELIDARITELGDWRGERLRQVRALIRKAVPDVVEEWKWRGVPVWYRDGMICTGETYKAAVKVTFAKGASIDDPAKVFNASLEGNARRAIDIHEDDMLDEAAFMGLIRAAVALNGEKKSKKK